MVPGLDRLQHRFEHQPTDDVADKRRQEVGGEPFAHRDRRAKHHRHEDFRRRNDDVIELTQDNEGSNCPDDRYAGTETMCRYQQPGERRHQPASEHRLDHRRPNSVVNLVFGQRNDLVRLYGGQHLSTGGEKGEHERPKQVRTKRDSPE